MRHLLIFGGLAMLVGLTACKEKPAEVVVTETRELNSSDLPPKLGATSEERFVPPGMRAGGGARKGGYTFQNPGGWKQKPGTQFRMLNFAAGENDQVEIYLSESLGGLQGNVGRWFKQFGMPMPTPADVAKLEKITILGVEGVLVEASGTYSPGMGRPDAPGYGLAGAIAQTSAGILTIKMVGPEEGVKAEMEKFRTFCGSLKAN